MRYSFSGQWTEKAKEIALKLKLDFVELERIAVVESKGSKARRTIARIHSLGKVMQLGMQQRPFYVIELLSEQFNKQSEQEKTKTIIHELLHIPHCFGGGFRHHKGFVNGRTVEEAFRKLQEQQSGTGWATLEAAWQDWVLHLCYKSLQS